MWQACDSLNGCSPWLWSLMCGFCVVHKIFIKFRCGSCITGVVCTCLKNHYFMLCYFFQGGVHLEFLTFQSLGFSEVLKHWREHPCHIKKEGTTAFDGRLTKVLCPWSHFIIWLQYSAKKAETTYLHSEKHSWDLCDPDTCPLNFSVLKKNIATQARWKQALFPTFSVGKMSWNQS
jgi:hypothetical protein